MKIKNLEEYMILKEMATNNLNKRIDDKFYDYFMYKDTQWLVDNKDKIIDDFYSKDNKFERENGYYPNIQEFKFSNLKEEKAFFKKYLEIL